MSICLDIRISLENPAEAIECELLKHCMIVRNIIVPINDNYPYGLFKNDEVHDAIKFTNLNNWICWCGCDEQNWLKLTIRKKKIIHNLPSLEFSFQSKYDDSDSESDSASDSATDYEDYSERQQSFIDKFPWQEIAKSYSDYTYNENWNKCNSDTDSDSDSSYY